MCKKSTSKANGKNHSGRRGLEISLAGLEPDEAIVALLETPPPTKDKEDSESKDDDKEGS